MQSCAAINIQVPYAFLAPARSTSQSHSKPGNITRHELISGLKPSGRAGNGLRARNMHIVSAMPVGEVAVLPSLIPVLLRAFSAGLLLYSSLQWASARSDRKQVRKDYRLVRQVLVYRNV